MAKTKNKQTARKSTATPHTSMLVPPKTSPSQRQINVSTRSNVSSHDTSNSQLDPIRHNMDRILENKKNKQQTNLNRVAPGINSSLRLLELRGGGGLGKGKSGKIRINDEPVKRKQQNVLEDIRKLQQGHGLLIPRSPFHRLIREIVQDLFHADNPYKFQTAALGAIQEACEAFLVRLFEDSYLCTLHAKRVTLMVSDVRLVQRLQGSDNAVNCVARRC